MSSFTFAFNIVKDEDLLEENNTKLEPPFQSSFPHMGVNKKGLPQIDIESVCTRNDKQISLLVPAWHNPDPKTAGMHATLPQFSEIVVAGNEKTLFTFPSKHDGGLMPATYNFRPYTPVVSQDGSVNNYIRVLSQMRVTPGSLLTFGKTTPDGGFKVLVYRVEGCCSTTPGYIETKYSEVETRTRSGQERFTATNLSLIGVFNKSRQNNNTLNVSINDDATYAHIERNLSSLINRALRLASAPHRGDPLSVACEMMRRQPRRMEEDLSGANAALQEKVEKAYAEEENDEPGVRCDTYEEFLRNVRQGVTNTRRVAAMADVKETRIPSIIQLELDDEEVTVFVIWESPVANIEILAGNGLNQDLLWVSYRTKANSRPLPGEWEEFSRVLGDSFFQNNNEGTWASLINTIKPDNNNEDKSARLLLTNLMFVV